MATSKKGLKDFLTAMNVSLTSEHCALRTTTDDLEKIVGLTTVCSIFRREFPPEMITIISLITGCNCSDDSLGTVGEEAIDELHQVFVLVILSVKLGANMIIAVSEVGVKLGVNLVLAVSEVLASVRLTDVTIGAASGGDIKLGSAPVYSNKLLPLKRDLGARLAQGADEAKEAAMIGRGGPTRPEGSNEVRILDISLVNRDMVTPKDIGQRGRTPQRAAKYDFQDLFSITRILPTCHQCGGAAYDDRGRKVGDIKWSKVPGSYHGGTGRHYSYQQGEFLHNQGVFGSSFGNRSTNGGAKSTSTGLKQRIRPVKGARISGR